MKVCAQATIFSCLKMDEPKLKTAQLDMTNLASWSIQWPRCILTTGSLFLALGHNKRESGGQMSNLATLLSSASSLNTLQ